MRLFLAVAVSLACVASFAQETRPQDSLDVDQIKVVAFDVFGTVFDFADADRSQIGEYVEHVKSDTWQPLNVPQSWLAMPAHPDSAEGIKRLRRKFTVVTLSNGPVRLLTAMSKRAGVCWDAIVPIEMARVYKPNRDAYRVVMDLFHCRPSEVLMVTANPGFGDIKAAKELGMQSIVIRPDGLRRERLNGPADINELADLLGVTK
ncbi:MAG: HAD-IA family hydrolase [Planctomycetota bacterium]